MSSDRPTLRAVRPRTLQDDLLQDLQAAGPTPAPSGKKAPSEPAARTAGTAPPAAPTVRPVRAVPEEAVPVPPAPAAAVAPSAVRDGVRDGAPSVAVERAAAAPSGSPSASLLPAVEVRMTPLRWSLPRLRLLRSRGGMAFSAGPMRITVTFLSR